MYFRRLFKHCSPVSSLDKLLHTSVVNRSAFVKDVYKMLNYDAPFDPEEKEKVLKVINSSNEEEIYRYATKSSTINIMRHRESSGYFSQVEQLLDVEKFTPKTLEKLCNKILLEDLGVSATMEKKPEYWNSLEIRTLKTLFEKDVKPRVKVKEYSEGEKSIVGVKIVLHAVTFAKIDKKQTLKKWDIIPAIQNTSSQVNYVHDKLFNKAREVVDQIPVGDYYILEDMIPIMPKDSHNIIKNKMHLVSFRTSIITQLLLRSNLQAQVHTLKLSVLEKMFNLKIGTDRKSMAEHLKQIVGYKVGGENAFYADIGEEGWADFYHSARVQKNPDEDEDEEVGTNNLEKEMLANSLLLSVAFNSLVVAAEEGLFKKDK